PGRTASLAPTRGAPAGLPAGLLRALPGRPRGGLAAAGPALVGRSLHPRCSSTPPRGSILGLVIIRGWRCPSRRRLITHLGRPVVPGDLGREQRLAAVPSRRGLLAARVDAGIDRSSIAARIELRRRTVGRSLARA